MGLIWTVLIGFVVGAVARFLVPGKDSAGFIVTTLLGIGGSWFGSWIFGLLGFRHSFGIIGSVIGAVLLLVLVRWLRGRNH